jgi:hypothetical protein
MIELLNDNKFFLGIMLILLNLGSRYLIDEFSVHPDEYTRNIVLRRLAIFAVCFVGTKDIVVATLLTAGYIIIAQGVSSKSREGMENKKKMEEEEPKVDCPACDAAKPMFGDTMDPRQKSSSFT